MILGGVGGAAFVFCLGSGGDEGAFAFSRSLVGVVCWFTGAFANGLRRD